MTHTHDIFDTDKRMTIDPVTRIITNQSANKVLLMQGDHNSERITFEVPRFVEGHDMSLSTVAQIHFENGDSKDYYEADDLQVDPENDDEVIFSWLLSRNATKNSAAFRFHVKFRCYEDGEVVYEWNSASYDKFSIGAALDNGKVVVEQYSDAIIALEERVENVEKANSATIDTTLTMEGCPADAKAVGDALADCALKSELPEGFSGSWNDLEDKPFYEETSEVVILEERIGNTEYMSVADGAKDGYGDIYGNLSTYGLVIGDTYVLTLEGVDYVGVAEWVEDTSSEGNNGVQLDFYAEGQSESFAGLVSYSNVMYWSFTEPKNYSPSVPFVIKHVSSTVKILNEKFLPDTVVTEEDIPEVVNAALAQAKESGEFDGAAGYTPVRGTDYWTEADKAEIKSYVNSSILGGAW